MRSTGGLTYRKAVPSDESTIDRFMRGAYVNPEAWLGYPRCENLDELLAEIAVYESSLKESVYLLSRSGEAIGVFGVLKGPGEDSGYFFGPAVEVKDQSSDILDLLLRDVLTREVLGAANLVVCVPEENAWLYSFCLENFTAGKTYIEMEFDTSARGEGNTAALSSCIKELTPSLDQDITSRIEDLFNTTFGWDASDGNFDGLLKNRFRFMYMTQEDGGVSGAVCWDGMDDTDFSRIEYLAVRPDSRRRGIGGDLLKAAVNRVSLDRTKKRVFLSLSRENDGALSLYRDAGFSVGLSYTTFLITLR